MAVLQAAIEVELRDAQIKTEQAWHWGGVGQVVRQAALDARQAVEVVLAERLPVAAFVERCHARLTRLAQRHDASNDDAWSYYAPTVLAIARSLHRREESVGFGRGRRKDD